MKAIFASDLGGGFGYKGRLPWGKVPEDLTFFRKMTNNKFIVMGRKTHETLPKLENRINVVISGEDIDNVLTARSIDDILALEGIMGITAFVIGGAQLLSVDTLKKCDEIYHTTIKSANDYDVKIGEDVLFYLSGLEHEVLLETEKCIIRRYYAKP